MLRAYKPPLMLPSCPDTYRECNMLKCFSALCYHTLLYHCCVRVISCVLLTSGMMPFAPFITCPFGMQGLPEESEALVRTWAWPACSGPSPCNTSSASPAVAVGEGTSILAAHLCNLLYRSEEQLERLTQKSKMSLDHFWYADVAKEIGRIYINSPSS